MLFRVLGPLTVGSPFAAGERLTAPKPRKALALLLMHADRVVPTDLLFTELWDDEPPASAQTTLQTYILQIRRMLARTFALDPAAVARDLLVTASDGYRMQVRDRPGAGGDELDLHCYERLAAQGRHAADCGDHGRAARLLGQALDVWRGAALVDVRVGAVLRVETRRLEEDRLATWKQRIDADLALDRHHEILGELSSLAARHPLHEDLQAQYMIALYRAGRRTDALQAFQQLRGVLLDDLGLEPSRRMQHIQRAILSADPALDASAPYAEAGVLAGAGAR
ncbi:AfsR/SARP family transcriptional regulator [Catellatospora sp. KI3]|uniref:AfsR/SARP family transcriptional regulator n=1 Tax=Catellatospora sp. KI3 TaxID=3041620 RepID=UPI002482F027|nr:AfsR/SARP family transcriptional regulator [Catellatospora sp. KI3]MDI1463879.1 AfsR/SARP family transcriptional regulator [Catellatospora sp. KI3]